MKKTLIIIAILFAPFITHAQTPQQQYEDALRQVITLLQQQVALLIEQLNAVNAQTAQLSPTYTYTPMKQPEPIVLPTAPTPTPAPTFGSTPTTTPVIIPDYEHSTIQESENTATYSFTNRAETNKQYASFTVLITPKTIVSNPKEIIIASDLANNPGSQPFITAHPATTTEYTIPFIKAFPAKKTTQLFLEVNAHNVGHANDRYTIELVSLND